MRNHVVKDASEVGCSCRKRCDAKFVFKRKTGFSALCLTSSLSSSPIGLSLPAPLAPSIPLLAARCFFSGLVVRLIVSVCLAIQMGEI